MGCFNRIIMQALFLGCLLFTGCKQKPFYSWQLVYEGPEDVSFRGIDAVSDSVCWVSGSKGAILKTTDGGQSWQQLVIPGADTLDFRDIEAFGADTAVVMSIGSGMRSKVFRTVDGGESWSLVHQNTYENGFYDAIAFWDNGQDGLLQGDPVEGRLFILTTNDGGQSWNELPREQMPEVADGEYAFAASGTQLITTGNRQAWIGTGGVNARAIHSSDGGQTWTARPTPMIQGEPSTGIFSIAFRDDSFGIAVGGDYTREYEGMQNVIYTEDRGMSWKRLENADLDFRSCIRFADGVFVTTGPSGSEYSTDNGENWKGVKGPGFHTLSIGKEGMNAVWAAGAEGRIGKLIRINGE